MSRTIPLTPKAGGMCLDPASLQPADIVVSTTGGFNSWVIRAATGSRVSHASIYVGDSQVIEAVPPRVRQVSVGVALGDAILAVVYRRKEMEASHQAAVIGFLRKHRDTKSGYDTVSAGAAGGRANPVLCVVLLGIPGCMVVRSGLVDNPNRFYCSELVLAAFEAAGRPIIDIPSKASIPNHVVNAYSNGLLEYVGHLKA